MSVLDLALRFNPRPSDETLARAEGTVPSTRSLGQLSESDKPLVKLDKRPFKGIWDSWDSTSRLLKNAFCLSPVPYVGRNSELGHLRRIWTFPRLRISRAFLEDGSRRDLCWN